MLYKEYEIYKDAGLGWVVFLNNNYLFGVHAEDGESQCKMFVDAHFSIYENNLKVVNGRVPSIVEFVKVGDVRWLGIQYHEPIDLPKTRIPYTLSRDADYINIIWQMD